MVLLNVFLFIWIIVQVGSLLGKKFVRFHYLKGQPTYGHYPTFTPSSPLSIREGSNQLIQPPSEYVGAQWTRGEGQPLPSGISQHGNALQITGARSDHSGTYYCDLYGADGRSTRVQYEIHVQPVDKLQPAGGMF